MGTTNFYVVCICALLQFSASTQEPIAKPLAPPGTLTECGQTIVADNGTIQYKLNEPYDAGEICIFVIQFESAYIEAIFTLENEGFSDLDQNAIFVSGLYPASYVEGSNLGHSKTNVTLHSSGAVIYFKTKSGGGTGFKLSFRRERIFDDVRIPGVNMVFNNETASPLQIPLSPYNVSDHYVANYYFTAGSKMITEAGSYFKLTVAAELDSSYPTPCYSGVLLLTFENEKPTEEYLFCYDFQVELRTRGAFIVSQAHNAGDPMSRGTIQWEVITEP